MSEPPVRRITLGTFIGRDPRRCSIAISSSLKKKTDLARVWWLGTWEPRYHTPLDYTNQSNFTDKNKFISKCKIFFFHMSLLKCLAEWSMPLSFSLFLFLFLSFFSHFAISFFSLFILSLFFSLSLIYVSVGSLFPHPFRQVPSFSCLSMMSWCLSVPVNISECFWEYIILSFQLLIPPPANNVHTVLKKNLPRLT